MRKFRLAVTACALLAIASCSSDTVTDPSMRSLRYESGATQGGEFVECVEPGKKLTTNDTLYPYPFTQREAVWDSDHYGDNGTGSADYPDLEVFDQDGIPAYLKVKAQFFLNTDCEPVTIDGREYEGGTLQVFHEFIGKTREAYFTDEGKSSDGWVWAMTNYLAGPTDKLANRAARGYTVEDIWRKTSVHDAIAEAIEDELQDSVDGEMQTDLSFYKNFSISVFGAVPDEDFRKLFQERKTAQIRAETAETNQEARVAEAEADAAVARAEAQILKAEIAGYGSVEAYNDAQMIKKGMNPRQPTYLVGGTSVK